MVTMQNYFKCNFLIFSLLLLLFSPACSSIQRNAAQSSSAAVSTENPEVTRIVADILKSGGNAFDASVAATFALSVIRPHSTGIGGGGFFLIHQKKQGLSTFLDARERGPAAISKTSIDQVSVSDTEKKGMLVGVPGIVAGAWEVFNSFGSGNLSWAELLQPAIELAENGFEVYPHLAEAIALAEKRLGFTLPPEIEKDTSFRNPVLAKTLSGIANNGPKYFYQGRVAQDIVEATLKRGGLLSISDLKNYRVKYREPVRFSYKGREVLSAPLPSSGGIVLGQALALREKLDSGLNDFDSIESLEFLIKSLSLSFRTRALYLGDPDYSDLNQEDFLSASAIEELASEINDSSVLQKPETNFEPIPTSTTHFSIIDFDGNVVSSTQSINLYFGAGFVAEGTGVFLNNTLDDFSKTNRESNAFGLAGRQANFPEGGKTPLSSMSPTIVLNDGVPELILGSPGGPRIISAVLQTIINSIDYGMDLESAVSSPRIHTQWDPPTVYLENRNLKLGLESKLNNIGFSTKRSDYLIGNVSAVSVNPAGEINATADPRRDGYGLVIDK